MIKNLKLSTVITSIVSIVVAVCMLMLFLLSNNSMMAAMKETSINNMNTSLEAKTQTIEEYVENSDYSYMPQRGWAVVMSDSTSEIYSKAQKGDKNV